MEGVISRDPEALASAPADLVIVGAGVYGITLCLEAARRGLRPVLLERDDFGAATSWNSLRICHGGLRYLQGLDLPRFGESVAERRWFLRHFPDQVEPLSCLMPLYGEGLRRAPILRTALAMNDFLSRTRNRGVREDRQLPKGRVLDADTTRAAFPQVDAEGLRGAALWFDAVMPDTQRLLIEMLRWACACGARVANYSEVVDLLCDDDGQVAGVRARDRQQGREFSVRTPRVLNATGPGCRLFAARFDRERPALFEPSLAFNALLDRPPLSAHAVAVAPRRPGGRTYFLHPWKGRVFAGTYHAAWSENAESGPPEPLVKDFLKDLNQAIPGFEVGPEEVLRLHWGLLPARRPGSDALAVREVILDHAAEGGPRGLFSVSGVKFTTARKVAEKTLRRIFGSELGAYGQTGRPESVEVPDLAAFERLLAQDESAARRCVRRLARDEAAFSAADLLLRRSDWGISPDAEKRLEPVLDRLLAES